MPICRHHKTKFEAKYFNQKYCLSDDECIRSFNEFVKAEKQKQYDKKAKAEKKELKEKVMSLSEWQAELEKETNRIICLIDKGSGCISCNGHTTPQSGHFHSVGSNRPLMFHLDNMHLQDYNCNHKKSANIQFYDLGLIERYGREYWEYCKFELTRKHQELKMPKHEYKEKISIAREIVKELKSINLTYSPKVRLELRRKYNERLGIYK